MFYVAHVIREGKLYTASFLDCPGCATSVSNVDVRRLDASTVELLREQATVALNEWLADRLSQGKIPMRPINYCRGKRIRVDVFPDIATALIDRWRSVGLYE